MRPAVVIAYICPSIPWMIREVLTLEGCAVATTDSAAEVYEWLCTSPRPLLAFLGQRLVDGTSLDVLRAVAEDRALQRHQYIGFDMFGWFFPGDEAERREFAALSKRFGMQRLTLPFNVAQLFAVIEAAEARAGMRGGTHA